MKEEKIVEIDGPNGKIDVVEVDFEVTKATADILKLDDGTEVKVRVNINRVWRAVNKFQDDGTPIYLLNTSIQHLVDPQPYLCKPKS